MALYNYSVKQTLLNAIKAENPAFAKATLDQLVFSAPTVVSGATTSVKVRGKPGSGFTGGAVVQYQRINVDALIKGRPNFAVQQYNATKAADIIPRLNQLYGLNFTVDDISTGNNVLSGTSTLVQFNCAPSLQYYGSMNVQWTKGSTPQLWELYPNTQLESLTVPVLMLKAFQVDFSANAAVLDAVVDGTVFTTDSAPAVALVDLLATKTGLPVTLGATAVPGTGAYDMSGFTITHVTQDKLTDSNPDYRKVAVLTPPATYGKQYSTIYLHYEKIVAVPTSTIITVTELADMDLPT